MPRRGHLVHVGDEPRPEACDALPAWPPNTPIQHAVRPGVYLHGDWVAYLGPASRKLYRKRKKHPYLFRSSRLQPSGVGIHACSSNLTGSQAANFLRQATNHNCRITGFGFPFHRYSKCAPWRTLETSPGRKHAMHSPPGRRTLRYSTPFDPESNNLRANA